MIALKSMQKERRIESNIKILPYFKDELYFWQVVFLSLKKYKMLFSYPLPEKGDVCTGGGMSSRAPIQALTYFTWAGSSIFFFKKKNHIKKNYIILVFKLCSHTNF